MSTLYLMTETKNNFGTTISVKKGWKERNVHFTEKKLDLHKVEIKRKTFVIHH